MIGTVRSVKGVNVLAETPFGDISAVLTKDVRVRPGGKVTLFFRPEHVECCPSGEQQRQMLKGRRRETEYQGKSYRVELGAGEERACIDIPPEMLKNIGQEITFTVPEEKVLIFPGS